MCPTPFPANVSHTVHAPCRVANDNKMYFLGYSDSTASSLASSFCKTNGYTGAGTTVKVGK